MKRSSIFEMKPQALKRYLREIIDSPQSFSQEEIKDAILLSSMNPVSFDLAEGLSRKFIDSSNETLQLLAITAVGHIARVYKKRVGNDILGKLEAIYKTRDSALWGVVDMTYDDLNIFLHLPKPT